MSDPISRDDAIKAFEKEKQKAKEIRDDFAKFPDSVFEQSIFNEAVKAWRTAINIVKKLPTIERKKGKWIETDDGWDGTYYVCSECGCPWTLIDGEPEDNGMNYCPNCGSFNGGEE